MVVLRRYWMLLAWLVLWGGGAWAQDGVWKLGGDGLPWAAGDTTRVMIDVDSAPGSIQPVYIQDGQNIIDLLDNWSTFRLPKDLGHVNGERPRIWKWNEGNGDPTQNGSQLIDADPTTYNASRAEPIERQFFTIDLAVPMPVGRFGFITPSVGFRADGTPLRTDVVPGFQVSVQAEDSEIFAVKGPHPLDQVVSEVLENLKAEVRVEFPSQYVRFIRYVRKLSLIDEDALSRCVGCGGQGNQALALPGSISEFQVFGRGVPRQAIYKSKVIALGEERNFGRLFFDAVPMRLVDGVAVEAPDGAAAIRVEVRTGRDDDPSTYHEYTVTGKEKEVSREVYENELRNGFARTCASCDFVQRSPRPGLQASIGYDSENWTFWSPPFTQSGQPLGLSSGSHIQVRITLESEAFDDFVRLNSLWIEQAPLLARQVVGEVALLEDMQPSRGLAQVALGQEAAFAYDVHAVFDGGQNGFDALRIHTGNVTRFLGLEIDGEPDEPEAVIENEEGLTIHLSQRVTRTTQRPMRLVFRTELFQLATTFAGEVFDSADMGLPQPIVGGDAGEGLSTNSLQVIARSEGSPRLVQNLQVSSAAVTPNGDGVNDRIEVSYALFGLPEPVSAFLEIYALDGRRVARIDLGAQGAGDQVALWDGRGRDGALLPPGLYLMAISTDSEREGHASLRPIGLAY